MPALLLLCAAIRKLHPHWLVPEQEHRSFRLPSLQPIYQPAVPSWYIPSYLRFSFSDKIIHTGFFSNISAVNGLSPVHHDRLHSHLADVPKRSWIPVDNILQLNDTVTFLFTHTTNGVPPLPIEIEETWSLPLLSEIHFLRFILRMASKAPLQICRSHLPSLLPNI